MKPSRNSQRSIDVRFLFLLFIVTTALEIGLLILSGNVIGVWPTIGLIILTGILGSWLAKRQGAEVIRLAQVQIRNGDMPSAAIMDGICVLAGGILLITPGFITDVSGFLLLIPKTRVIVKMWMRRGLRKMIHRGTFFFIRK